MKEKTYSSDNPITIDDLVGLVRSKMENTEPAHQVALLLERYDDKKVTKHMCNHVAKNMPEYDVTWNTQYGMTHIDVKGEGMYGKADLHMLVCHNTRYPFSIERFRDSNARDLTAADKRNDARKKALGSRNMLLEVVSEMNNYIRAKEKLSKMLEYGEPLYADVCAIQRMYEKK